VLEKNYFGNVQRGTNGWQFPTVLGEDHGALIASKKEKNQNKPYYNLSQNLKIP
jgi:hypothetical protein